MNDLEERFKREIDKQNFNLFEIQGFQKQPKLAIICGMAIGYKLGLEDSKKSLDELRANIVI